MDVENNIVKRTSNELIRHLNQIFDRDYKLLWMLLTFRHQTFRLYLRLNRHENSNTCKRTVPVTCGTVKTP